MDQTPETVLDVVPYNQFSRVCTAATSQDLVGVKRSVQWRRDGATLTDDGDATVITEQGSNSQNIVSNLTRKESSEGVYTFSCVGIIDLPDVDTDVTETLGFELTVQGLLILSNPSCTGHTVLLHPAKMILFYCRIFINNT